jgi:hypothetical protein
VGCFTLGVNVTESYIEIRKRIEEKIAVDTSKAMFNPQTNCFDVEKLDEYLGHWHDLARYYEMYNDFTISVETVREYLEKINHFFQVWKYKTTNPKCQEYAQEALQELETSMKDITSAVERKIYPYGR